VPTPQLREQPLWRARQRYYNADADSVENVFCYHLGGWLNQIKAEKYIYWSISEDSSDEEILTDG